MRLEPLERRRLLSRWSYYVGVTFHGTPDREALELVGRRRVVVAGDVFYGGSTQLRFVDCRDVVVRGCTFYGADGVPDPNGQDLQLLRSTGVVTDNVFYASPAHSEDLCSVFSDQPVVGAVTISGNVFYGRGASDSSTSVCLDGPACPPTAITGNRIVNARDGICVAGGIDHVITGNVFARCDTPIFVSDFYHSPGFGSFTIRRNRDQ